MSSLLNDVFGGPDLYVNWPRTDNTYPWDPNYKPTPFAPSADAFHNWGLFRNGESESDSSYFMSQEAAAAGAGTMTSATPTPAPTSTSCTNATPAQQCKPYNGEPLPVIHDPYKPPQISVTDREVGCGTSLFRQETVEGTSDLNQGGDNITELVAVLVLGGVIAYAVMLALGK